MSQASKPTNRLVPITIIAVLVIAVALLAILLPMQISKANKKVDDANAQIATLQSQLSSAQSNASSLQTQLTAAQKDMATQKAALDAANSQVSSLNQQVSSLTTTTNSQAAQIKTMSYPRHFATVTELTNWLQKDDTDKMFGSVPVLQLTDLQKAQMAIVLQVKAARDGFIITVNLPQLGGLGGITNRALIGDTVYTVRAYDDFVEHISSVSPALPSYPIPPP